MKRFIVLLLVLLCSTAFAATTAVGLKNGDFEKGNANLPEFWTVNPSAGATATWEQNGGIDNSHCISVTVTKPTKGEGVIWSQDVQLEPYKAYLLKGYIKGTDVKLGVSMGTPTGASLATSMWLCDTIRLKEGPKAVGTFDWTPFTIDFATGPDGKATIMCRFGRENMVGKAFFDDLKVYPNPDTEKFESKHFVLNLYKDEIAAATRQGVVGQLKNVDKLYEAYKELTGHEPGDNAKGSAYAPKMWGIEAMGWSGNPLLWIADKKWMETYWSRPDYCAEIFLHEMAHNFDIDGPAFDMHFSELMFYYACENQNFCIGEDKGPHKGKNVRARWELRGAEAGVPDPAYVIHKLIPFIDRVGWEPIKETYRSYLTKTPIAGLPGTEPGSTKNRWNKFKTYFDRLSFFAKQDAWSIFTPEEIAMVEKCFNDPNTMPTIRPDEVKDDIKTAWLSDLRWDNVLVGYGGPCRNYNEAGFPLRSWERYHEKGIGIHAPAQCVYNLNGKWKSFDVYCALIRRSSGSVIFTVKGDGKEIYRSDVVKDKKERHITLDVTGVKKLELLVDDAGDGKTWDWGMWFSPQLSR